LLEPFQSFAPGVGHQPKPEPKVIGTSGRSRYALPFRVIPAGGQVSENSAQPPSKDPWNVFHDNEPRS
jgi:hypothetical protein